MVKYLNCEKSISQEVKGKLIDLALEKNVDLTLSNEADGVISVQVSSRDNRMFELFRTFDSFESLYL